MRPKTIAPMLLTLAMLTASVSAAATMDGTVKLGGIFLDETGDRSTVQETYNIYDGFSVSQIQLMGTLNPTNFFMLNLTDINLDSRQGDLTYRIPGTFKATGRYRQHRQVFSPNSDVNSRREDWRAGAQYTPNKWLALNGSLDYVSHDGDRLSFPTATPSWLGTGYDNRIMTGNLTADVHRGRNGGGLTYRASSFHNHLDGFTDRRGQVVSGRFYAPTPFYDKWTNLVRGAYGTNELSNGGLDYTLLNFQYTGIVQPVTVFQFKYRFDANRIDNKSTDLMTDRYQNDFDATYSQPSWRVSGGYGYELNDDDRSLTSYNSWRAGAAYHHGNVVNAKVDYAGRVKTDLEKRTLLNDFEASRIAAKLDVRPFKDLVVGGAYSMREREFTDIGVTSEGDIVSAFGRYDYAGWGDLSADYSYSDDQYKDLAGRFESQSHVVTGRVNFDRIKGVHLGGGVTYLDIRGDLQIEKSIIFAEGRWTPFANYHLEVKYNVFNYDDYVLLDRYYTANVVRVNLAYDLHL